MEGGLAYIFYLLYWGGGYDRNQKKFGTRWSFVYL